MPQPPTAVGMGVGMGMGRWRGCGGVGTGIGAEPYLDRLQGFLKLNNHQDVGLRMIELQKEYWPDAKREFYPIDIEYQSCECRKYFSYVNGTKKFEGKNLFQFS